MKASKSTWFMLIKRARYSTNKISGSSYLLNLQFRWFGGVLYAMDRIRLKSNDIQSVGYDESLQILEIQFRHGGIYRYFGVPKKIYDGLVKSVMSHGQYHERYIKNRYRHEKVWFWLAITLKTNASWLVTPVLLRHDIRDVQTHTTLLYNYRTRRLKASQCSGMILLQHLLFWYCKCQLEPV